MMWAATVRRCPTGHARHPSQFGARLQLARALTQAPYLISYPPPTHAHLNTEGNVPYLSCEDPNPASVCDHVVDCDGNQPLRTSLHHNHRGPCLPGAHDPARMPRGRRTRREEEDEVRVELPYSRRELDAQEDLPLGDRVVRRYDEVRWRDEAPEDDGVVGLSYQQRSLGGGTPYGGEVWGTEPSMDCWGETPLLLKRGRTRELVRTLFVLGLSLTLVTFVVMGFEVYNMLITTLFLVFLLCTISLLIFLLMRKPACSPCCRDPFDIPNGSEETGDTQQQGLSTYLTESQGVVLKKKLSDSPPPYESPPDYHSLPPEVLVNARGLGGIESSSDSLLAKVHGREPLPPITPTPQGPQAPQAPARRGNKLRGFMSRPSSSAAPLLASIPKPPPLPSPAASPSLCSSGGLLGLTSSCRSHAEAVPTPPPPPYECVVLQTEATHAARKSC